MSETIDDIAVQKESSVIVPEQTGNAKVSRTFGNKMFDWAVWAPIQWAGVWVFSLFLANSASKKDGKLAPMRDWGTEKLTPIIDGFIKGKDRLLKSEKSLGTLRGSTAKEWAGSATIIAALGLGGTLLIPITKFLEDRRLQIATWFDKVFGKEQKDESLVKEEPEQTWSSLIKGRGAALLMAYSVLAAIGIKNINKIQNSIGNWSAGIFMKSMPKNRMPFVKNKTGNWNESNIKNWARLGVLDLFLTAAAASLHYASSRSFAAGKKSAASPETPVALPLETSSIASNAEAEKQSGSPNYSKNLTPKSDSWIASEIATRQQESPRGLA